MLSKQNLMLIKPFFKILKITMTSIYVSIKPPYEIVLQKKNCWNCIILQTNII